MARLALALDTGTEDRLLADMVEAGHTILARLVGWRDVVESLDRLAPDLVIVGAGRGTLSPELLQACDVRGIRLIALASDDRERALASRIGLHEVLPADSAWSDVERLVSGGVPVPSRVGDAGSGIADGASRGGASRASGEPSVSVIAVWGPGGAPGRTLVSVNLAAELAAAGHRVVLVDADPYGGAIAATLGLLDEAPGFAAACRLAGADGLDRTEIERLAQRYSSPRASFDVLSGLVGPSRWPELSESRVTAALAGLRAWAEYVVVDTGFSLERDEELTSDQFAPRRNAATFATLAAADRVVAVGVADPVGLSRLLRGHAELIEHVDAERVDVVANRVRSSALGIDAHAQIRQTMRRFAGIADVTMLPHDGRAADAAILTARTLRDAAPRSPLRTAIRDFALTRYAPVAEPRGRSRAARALLTARAPRAAAS
ncbi:regulator [Agromyces sp. CFH 90414]|uniref:Regulator n=1 Tax=Agromyces agglutinans TaxID=2662258 RepID=A0A6I2FIM9_9MICO|nr:regulator [Agromyces agglutinans]MRG60608.1 regulator [Agromyces agglutinans]